MKKKIQQYTIYCFICNKLLNENECFIVDRGLQTLIDASIGIADGFSEYLKSKKTIKNHKQCRKNNTRKCNITAAKRQRDQDEVKTSNGSPPRTRLGVSESAFCFEQCYVI